MNQMDKVKAFVVHILGECEQEGFTFSEVAEIPRLLKSELHEHQVATMREIKFRKASINSGNGNKHPDIHRGN